MKNNIGSVCISILAVLTGSIFVYAQSEGFKWGLSEAIAHEVNRNDETKWEKSLLEEDISVSKRLRDSDLPIKPAAFPVPDYDLVGKDSFRGMGNFGFLGPKGRYKKIGNKKLVYNTFFAFKNQVNKRFVGREDADVFFRIVVLTDNENLDAKGQYASYAISRNHPHYLGEGMFKTQDNKIEYLAFVTADRNAYAIVNMRLFDLKLGRTILIAPQKDGSVRSLQIESPDVSYKDIDHSTDLLLESKSVREFFLKDSNV